MSKTVYLIDKDPAVIDVISLMLEDEGFHTVVASKPFAIQEVRDIDPALILLHNGLDNHGVEICTALKADTETLKIPVIMSSTSINLPELSCNAGAEAYIFKPFDLADFCALIRATLSSPDKACK
ncbi:MAG: response regulator [Chitinophagaceae bacterium]|nr:MAG: response regulator [Chitinophagaceae bacterium]